MSKIYVPFFFLAIASIGSCAAPAKADDITLYETQSVTVAPVDPNYQVTGTVPQTQSSVAMSQSTDDQLQPMHQGNVTYMTGGIGDEERNTLDAAKKDYNLHITNADKTGAFTGNTQITILDRQGHQVLNAPAGPIFLASLPAGRYLIEASDGGQTKKQTITVQRNRAESIHLAW